jgi:hypothetical protein
MRAVSASIVLVVLAVPVQQVPSRDAPAEKTGMATLSGRVLAGDTGSPLREVTVTISSGELQQSHRATTDAQGRFEFTALPGGRWLLNASPPRYRAGYLGTTLRFGSAEGRVVVLSDGEELKNVDISLDRAGAISGRVTDEFGESMANVRINVLSAASGGMRAGGFGLVVTDDYGRFRAFGLEPGSYYVKAEGLSQGMMSPVDSSEGYLATYYPGTTNLAEAPRVSLDRGQEVAGLEIRMVRSRTFRITGLVLGSDGRPAARAFVNVIVKAEGGGTSGFGRMAGSEGTFEITGLAPGDYWLSARPSGSFVEDREASSPMKVTIAGSDVENITLAMTPGLVLEGQIVTDDGSVPALPIRGLEVMVVPGDPDVMGGFTSRGSVKEDWTFRIENVRGPVLIRTMGSIGPRWRLKQVLYRGQDITERPTEFKEAPTAQDLRLVVSNRGATLTGLVTDAAGRPAIQKFVMLYPEERELRSVRSIRFRTGRSDESGRYRITLLPPGDYLAVALDSPAPVGPWGRADASQFVPLERFSRRVTILGEGEQTLDLRVAELKER